MLKVSEEPAYTKDGISAMIDAVVCMQIMDPVKASYAVEKPLDAVTRLANQFMRKEISKLPVRMLSDSQKTLRSTIAVAVSDEIKDWGIKCLRYEITGITLPREVLEVMEMVTEVDHQMKIKIEDAEAKKQITIDDARAKKEAIIQAAEAERRSIIITGEGTRLASVLIVEGEAKAHQLKEEAKGKAISIISNVLKEEGADRAAKFRIARQYNEAFGKIVEQGTTVILPKCEDEKDK